MRTVPLRPLLLAALALACGGGGSGTGGPTGPTGPAGERWRPSSATPLHWHWQLSEDLDVEGDLPLLPHRTVFDLDGEQTPKSTVDALHALGATVICYIDAGAYEDYRSDAHLFPAEVIGNPDVGWEGAYWLDIRRLDVLLPIMRHRMEDWCLAKGFDAVEPDETEVVGNNSGFEAGDSPERVGSRPPLTQEDNDAYNRAIAGLAHDLGLSVGLKGNNARAALLAPAFDWALSEQCWQYGECEGLRDGFTDQGKAAFVVEYEADPDCARSRAWRLNAVRRDLELVGPTHPDYRYEPCVADDVDVW
jgi:hypothetical protein